MENLRILRIEHTERIFAFGGKGGEIHYLPRFAGYGIGNCGRGGAAPNGIAGSIEDERLAGWLIQGVDINGSRFLLMGSEAQLIHTNGVACVILAIARHEQEAGDK